MIFKSDSNNKFEKILEDIAVDNRTLLVDTSASEDQGTLRYLRQINCVKSIDSEFLIKNTIYLYYLRDLFLDKRVYTIPEISDELYYFQQGLGKNRFRLLKDFNRYEKNNFGESNPIFLRNRELVENLHDLVSELHDISIRKELIIEDDNYSLILDLIKSVSIYYNCKIDKSFILNERDYIKDSDTDEKLTSTSLWISSELREKTSIVTSDTDFLRIMGNFINEIKDRNLPKFFTSLYDKIQENSLFIYYIPHYNNITVPNELNKYDINQLAYMTKKKFREKHLSMTDKALMNKKLIDIANSWGKL